MPELKSQNAPLVSVLMSAYNSEQYITEAVDSILNQSYSNLEFIIVNDGSTDRSASILQDYAARDARIVLLQNEVNLGLSRSLNVGLDVARGKYVARMDSDDVSTINRIARQVAYMDSNPQIGICGSWAKKFGKQNGTFYRPLSNKSIQSHLFFKSALVHPTVMVRREILSKYNLRYDPACTAGQDYVMWVEAAPLTSFANLPEELLFYRTHSRQVSSVNSSGQSKSADIARLHQLARLGMPISDEVAAFHLKVAKLDKPLDREFVTHADEWLQRLKVANKTTSVYPEPEFSTQLDQQWFAVCWSAMNLGMFAWNSFWRSPLSKSVQLSGQGKLRFRLLCAFPALRNIGRQYS